jgi:hypothetical protein
VLCPHQRHSTLPTSTSPTPPSLPSSHTHLQLWITPFAYNCSNQTYFNADWWDSECAWAGDSFLREWCGSGMWPMGARVGGCGAAAVGFFGCPRRELPPLLTWTFAMRPPHPHAARAAAAPENPDGTVPGIEEYWWWDQVPGVSQPRACSGGVRGVAATAPAERGLQAHVASGGNPAGDPMPRLRPNACLAPPPPLSSVAPLSPRAGHHHRVQCLHRRALPVARPGAGADGVLGRHGLVLVGQPGGNLHYRALPCAAAQPHAVSVHGRDAQVSGRARMRGRVAAP